MKSQPPHHYSGEDRRQAVRMPYCTQITYANRNRTGVGEVRDISSDGLFFETPIALVVGDQIEMDFRFRHTTANVAIAGEIRHASSQGVGVRLLW